MDYEISLGRFNYKLYEVFQKIIQVYNNQFIPSSNNSKLENFVLRGTRQQNKAHKAKLKPGWKYRSGKGYIGKKKRMKEEVKIKNS